MGCVGGIYSSLCRPLLPLLLDAFWSWLQRLFHRNGVIFEEGRLWIIYGQLKRNQVLYWDILYLGVCVCVCVWRRMVVDSQAEKDAAEQPHQAWQAGRQTGRRKCWKRKAWLLGPMQKAAPSHPFSKRLNAWLLSTLDQVSPSGKSHVCTNTLFPFPPPYFSSVSIQAGAGFSLSPSLPVCVCVCVR